MTFVVVAGVRFVVCYGVVSSHLAMEAKWVISYVNL